MPKNNRSQNSRSQKTATKSSLRVRMGYWLGTHPLLAGLLIMITTWAVLMSIFWLQVFTDFSGAAEFLYAQF